MSKTIQYKVQVDTGNSVKSLNQLETELADINSQLKNVAPNSDAFKDLSKQAQDTTKQIDKVNKSINFLYEGINVLLIAFLIFFNRTSIEKGFAIAS